MEELELLGVILNAIVTWIKDSLDIIFAGLAGGLVYYMTSPESPRLKKFCSTVAGFVIAMVFAPPFCKYWNIVDYDFAIAAILALGGRWAAETILSVAKKFINDKSGV